jgi:hypothetical protein
VDRDADGAHSELLEMDNIVMDEPEEARSVSYLPSLFFMVSNQSDFFYL